MYELSMPSGISANECASRTTADISFSHSTHSCHCLCLVCLDTLLQRSWAENTAYFQVRPMSRSAALAECGIASCTSKSNSTSADELKMPSTSVMPASKIGTILISSQLEAAASLLQPRGALCQVYLDSVPFFAHPPAS